MKARPLDYLAPDAPTSRPRWSWRTSAIALGLLAIILASPAIPVKKVEVRVDAVTGSMRRRTVWFFLFSTDSGSIVSGIEKRLVADGVGWTPDWQVLLQSRHNIYGDFTGTTSGKAPAMYFGQPVLDGFAAAATDAELREFVRIMQSGSATEKQAAMDDAWQKGFAIWRGSTN